MIDRIRDGLEDRLSPEQAAYRRGRGTSEQIYILRNILEQSMEWQAPLYVSFIDFKKAFDSIIREKLWDILRQYGIPSVYVDIIRKLYDGSSSCVIENGRTTDWFKVQTGVRQGCVMSGFLFIIVVDWIMRNTNNKKRGIRWKFMSTLEDLDYADDLALISSKHSDMQEKTRRLHVVTEYTGLKINVDKTKARE